MREQRFNNLVQLRPQQDTLCLAQAQTAYAAASLDGFIHTGSRHGLFVHETHLPSVYRCRIDGQQPTLAALSKVLHDKHSKIFV